VASDGRKKMASFYLMGILSCHYLKIILQKKPKNKPQTPPQTISVNAENQLSF